MFSKADKTVKPSVKLQRKTEQSFFGSQKEQRVSAPESTFFKPAVQAKLRVNKPDDSYEKEADAVAESVVNMPEPQKQPNITIGLPDVQRMEETKDEEEETLQMSSMTIQRMVEEEQEDNTSIQAKQISFIQRDVNDINPSSNEEDETVQTYSSERPTMYHSDVIQRSGRGPPAGAGQFQSQLHNSTSGGQPMAKPVGNFMSSRFGADFSTVRIHTDTSAQQMSKQVNAHAFTYGNHIYFNSGKYDPDSKSGQTLLAHELTHTIQQGASPVYSNVQRKHNFTAVQRKSILQRQGAPQLTKAVELAEAEQGKVIANKEGADGYRYGWERLMEYFETTFGKDKIVSQPTGEKNIVPKQSIKKKSEFYGAVVEADADKNGKGMRDVMPSWCGIFAFWALNKSGIPMPKWQLGESFIPPEAAYPSGHIPKPGDIAYKEERSHYGLVVGMEGANRVKSVNGNTAGDDHMGGEIQVQTHDLSNWHAFFNPLVAKTGNLRDPSEGDKDTEPKTFKELRKLKYNVSRKAENENEEEDIQAKSENPQKGKEEEEVVQAKQEVNEKDNEEEAIQRSEIGGAGGFASKGIEMESDDSSGFIQTKAESTPAMQIRNKSPGKLIQGGWLGDAWDAVSGLASDVADLIEEGLDAAKNWLLDKVRDFVVEIPGYTLLSYILGYDPITGRGVNKTPITLLDAVLDIIPIGGAMVKWVLEYFEAINPVADWLFESVQRFSDLIASVESRFENFWNRLSIDDVANPEQVMNNVANLFQSIVTDIVDFVAEVGGDFLTMVKDIAISTLVTFVKEYFPDAYDLLVLLLGEDPISGEQVAFNGTNILNAALKVLGERGAQIKSQMLENGIFIKCVEWIDRSIGLVQDIISDVGNIFSTVWELITFDSLFSPIETFTEIAQAFLTPINRIIDFFTDAMIILIGILREALLERLSNYAKETRGYFLITVLIGRDPFSGKRVLRNTENMIHGFFSLMEGGEAQFQQLKESGKIDQMTQKVDKAVKRLNFTLEYVVGLFTSLWEALDWNDFLNPFEVFARIVATFGDPVIRLVRFVITIVQIVVELLLIAMNFPFETVNNIIQRSLEAFGNIKRDPIGFLKNILRGIKQGFTQFFDNILKHLMSGLANWLFGSLGELGIQMPPDLSFKSILNLIMQILGISIEHIMERVWLKLTEQIGAEKVAKIRGAIDKLTGIWTFIKDVMDRGPIAIWEFVQEKLSELWNIVLAAARNWIMTRIIASVTTKLLSMLDPTGIMAVINSVIGIYRAIQSFIEQLRAMLEILNSFVNGIAEIAAGNVQAAADYLEGAMARGIPVLIGFLANQVGLGGIGRRIAEIITSVRVKITEGIDWLVAKALRIGRPIIDGVIRVIEFGERVVGGIRAAFGSIFGFTAGGESHRLWVENSAGSTRIKVASTPMNLDAKINEWREAANGDSQKTAAINEVETEHSIATQKANALVLADQANDEQRVTTAQTELDSQMNILKTKVMVVFNLMPELIGDNIELYLSGSVGSVFLNGSGALNQQGIELQTNLRGKGYAVIGKTSERRSHIRRTGGTSNQAYHFDNDGKLQIGSSSGNHEEYQISNIDFMDFEGDTRDAFKINITTQNGNSFEASLMENELETTTQTNVEEQEIIGRGLARQRDTGVSGRSRMNSTTATGLHRAHLIANRFQGPGEAQSLNIILTSPTFNTRTMADVENSISDWIGDRIETNRDRGTLHENSILRFTMKVKATLEFNEGRSLARSIFNNLIANQFIEGEINETEMMNQIFEKLMQESNTSGTGDGFRRQTRKVEYFVDSSKRAEIGPDSNI
ncbi:DUF4157 domain-containing protein [uncultured Lacinutrix sp.]|uniref:eCIS core domain-containing protein n=1 Tax=uncultured Lacinutrix sp. TaxID=574032 RepID=UPI0026223ADD|nr:DUF4157 domain-containing protein [uncultured Lacinutrix sp.]